MKKGKIEKPPKQALFKNIDLNSCKMDHEHGEIYSKNIYRM